MISSQYIIFYLSGLLVLLLIALLMWYALPILRNKRKVRDDFAYSKYPTACAGSPKDGEPGTTIIRALDYTNFQTKDGAEINPDDYYVYVAKGDSMRFCNIHDGDLIFVAKGFRIVQLVKFPYILVLKRNNPEPGKSEYKIRRAWKIAKYSTDDQFGSVVRAIIASEEFQNVKALKNGRNKDAYPGDAAILADFENKRLPKFIADYINCDNPDPWNETVVISTTFDTTGEFIHFSIHPISSIVGIVKDSFTIDDANQE